MGQNRRCSPTLRPLRQPHSALPVAVHDRVLAGLEHDVEVAPVDRLLRPPAVDDPPFLADELEEGLRQVRAAVGAGGVSTVVEVAPWSRIPEARALLVPRDD